MLCCPGPGHQIVETRGGPEIDQFGEHVGEIGLRIDAVQFAGLDERRDASPVLRSLVMTCEECIFAIEHNGPDAPLDNIGVELDTAVFEETGEAVPMVQGITDGVGDQRLARDARELMLEPSP